MSVMKESATQQLIAHIKSAMAVGKIAEIDDALSETSINPVQNKIVTEAIENATSYKDGDTIYITGKYPCMLVTSGAGSYKSVVAHANIILCKEIPLYNYDLVAVSGSVRVYNDKGFIKADGVNIWNGVQVTDIDWGSIFIPSDYGFINSPPMQFSKSQLTSITDADGNDLPELSSAIMEFTLGVFTLSAIND